MLLSGLGTGRAARQMAQETAGIRNWEAAQKIVRDWEAHVGDELVAVKEAFARFIADCGDRNLARRRSGNTSSWKRMVAHFGLRDGGWGERPRFVGVSFDVESGGAYRA